MPYEGTLEALRSAARALKPGGRLLLESATVAESLLPGYRSELTYEAGGITMRAVNEYDPRQSRVIGDFSFEDAAGRVERGGGDPPRPHRRRDRADAGQAWASRWRQLLSDAADEDSVCARIPPSDRDFKDLALP